MRVLVFSDTHGRIEPALNIINKENYDLVLHAGDFYSDGAHLSVEASAPVYRVVGNCDEFEIGPEEKILDIEDKKVLLIHGHSLGVKSSYQKLFYRGCEREVDIVVFGHTHVPLNVENNGILLFNPGSVSKPVPGASPSYGILEIENNHVKGHIVYMKYYVEI